MILEGVVVVPRWSATSGSVVVLLLSLELLSQAKAVLHLVLAVLVEGAWAFEDFLVLLIIVMLGARFVNGGDDVVWPTVAILASFRTFRPIMATVMMVATVVVAAVIVASVIGAVIVAACWAMSARILVEVHLGFLSVSVLVGGHNHLTNPVGGLRLNLERSSR